MGGGDNESTQTTNPWSGAEPYLKKLLGDAWRAYETDPGYIGLTDEQKASIAGMKDFYSGGMGGTNATAQATWESLMRSPEEVATSKAIQDMIAANTSEIATQLSEEVLPDIRTGAAGAGQYGSSRQGIAEGVAAGKAADAATRYATDLTGNIYQQQLKNQMGALSASPLIQEMLGKQYTGVFDLEEMLRQDQIGAANSRWDELSKLANILYPVAGMGGSTQVSSPGASMSPWAGAAGGATAGSAFGPWGAAIGAGLGALSTKL